MKVLRLYHPTKNRYIPRIGTDDQEFSASAQVRIPRIRFGEEMSLGVAEPFVSIIRTLYVLSRNVALKKALEFTDATSLNKKDSSVRT
jgi:hypothetical protein